LGRPKAVCPKCNTDQAEEKRIEALLEEEEEEEEEEETTADAPEDEEGAVADDGVPTLEDHVPYEETDSDDADEDN